MTKDKGAEQRLFGDAIQYQLHRSRSTNPSALRRMVHQSAMRRWGKRAAWFALMINAVSTARQFALQNQVHAAPPKVAVPKTTVRSNIAPINMVVATINWLQV